MKSNKGKNPNFVKGNRPKNGQHLLTVSKQQAEDKEIVNEETLAKGFELKKAGSAKIPEANAHEALLLKSSTEILNNKMREFVGREAEVYSSPDRGIIVLKVLKTPEQWVLDVIRSRLVLRGYTINHDIQYYIDKGTPQDFSAYLIQLDQSTVMADTVEGRTIPTAAPDLNEEFGTTTPAREDQEHYSELEQSTVEPMEEPPKKPVKKGGKGKAKINPVFDDLEVQSYWETLASAGNWDPNMELHRIRNLPLSSLNKIRIAIDSVPSPKRLSSEMMKIIEVIFQGSNKLSELIPVDTIGDQYESKNPAVSIVLDKITDLKKPSTKITEVRSQVANLKRQYPVLGSGVCLIKNHLSIYDIIREADEIQGLRDQVDLMKQWMASLGLNPSQMNDNTHTKSLTDQIGSVAISSTAGTLTEVLSNYAQFINFIQNLEPNPDDEVDYYTPEGRIRNPTQIFSSCRNLLIDIAGRKKTEVDGLRVELERRVSTIEALNLKVKNRDKSLDTYMKDKLLLEKQLDTAHSKYRHEKSRADDIEDEYNKLVTRFEADQITLSDQARQIEKLSNVLADSRRAEEDLLKEMSDIARNHDQERKQWLNDKRWSEDALKQEFESTLSTLSQKVEVSLEKVANYQEIIDSSKNTIARFSPVKRDLRSIDLPQEVSHLAALVQTLTHELSTYREGKTPTAGAVEMDNLISTVEGCSLVNQPILVEDVENLLNGIDANLSNYITHQVVDTIAEIMELPKETELPISAFIKDHRRKGLDSRVYKRLTSTPEKLCDLVSLSLDIAEGSKGIFRKVSKLAAQDEHFETWNYPLGIGGDLRWDGAREGYGTVAEAKAFRNSLDLMRGYLPRE